jgi:membrane fusion protein (multidrug efflux system)
MSQAGCRNPEAARPTGSPAPVEVQVAAAEVQDVPVVREWIGTLDGRVNAEIRGQVSGYLLRQAYLEGAFVRKGQLLFEIDPRPFEAAVNQAKANLAHAESDVRQALSNVAQCRARLGKAQLDVKRYAPLVVTKAISQEEMDNAVQSELETRAAAEASQAASESAKAAVTAARAALYDAEVKLGFTKITSPIDGISGLAKIQVGDLVSPSGTELTTVSTVDPIKAYFSLSEQEYLEHCRENQKTGPGSWAKNLQLILADGSVYPHRGSFFMTDRQVDSGTGALKLAALFPNPGNVLRPGQYGRVRATIGVRKAAIVVPQRAVTELQGSYQVAVVGDDNKVVIRPVRLGERLRTTWVVEEGVQPGEQVIIEGLQRARSGATVHATPVTMTNGGK